jgi:hypothetical protein
MRKFLRYLLRHDVHVWYVGEDQITGLEVWRAEPRLNLGMHIRDLFAFGPRIFWYNLRLMWAHTNGRPAPEQ